MTSAKLAYLTTPEPNVFVINIQQQGSQEIERFEISEAHLSNIVADGAQWLLRKRHTIKENA